MPPPEVIRVYRVTLYIPTDRGGAIVETATAATTGEVDAAAEMVYRRVRQRMEATFEQHGATPAGYTIRAAALIRKATPSHDPSGDAEALALLQEGTR